MVTNSYNLHTVACRIAIAAALCLLSGVSPAQSLQPWVRTVFPPAGKPISPACVVLDPMIFALATPGLRDLRLMQDGAEIPYAVEESFDEHALAAGADAAADRSFFQTVTTLPLTADPDVPGGEVAYGWIPAHVPIERILLRPADGSRVPAGGSVQMELVAAPSPVFPKVGNKDVEVVDATLPALQSAEVTPLGANLQTFAAVLVRLGRMPAGARYDAVLLQMRRRSLCYQPRHASALQLFYGAAHPDLRRYAYAATFQPSAEMPLARLGPQQRNGHFHPAGQPHFWNRKTLLPLAAAALLLPLVLAGALLRQHFE